MLFSSLSTTKPWLITIKLAHILGELNLNNEHGLMVPSVQYGTDIFLNPCLTVYHVLRTFIDSKRGQNKLKQGEIQCKINLMIFVAI